MYDYKDPFLARHPLKATMAGNVIGIFSLVAGAGQIINSCSEHNAETKLKSQLEALSVGLGKGTLTATIITKNKNEADLLNLSSTEKANLNLRSWGVDNRSTISIKDIHNNEICAVVVPSNSLAKLLENISRKPDAYTTEAARDHLAKACALDQQNIQIRMSLNGQGVATHAQRLLERNIKPTTEKGV